ncbi:MAG: TatD family hydrolase [Candidatus Microsyncoccus archaeolyticus]|nr:MAG: TatD family hydrolase [Candidatus Parcubacteria bacterium]
MIDTHAHLNFPQFHKDRNEIISKCLENNISIINIGTDYKSSEEVIDIAREHNTYASIGLHPLDADQDFDYDKYKALINNKVVGIGETGLDYWYKPKGKARLEEYKKKQKEIFVKQIDLALEFNLPLIVHCRVAFDDAYEILKNKKLKGVIHSFTGSDFDLERFLSLGYYIGINGIIFKMDLKSVIEKAPIDKILIETDCPFLSPPGFEERNNPLSLKIIAEEIAKIKNISLQDLIKITDENAVKLFDKMKI